MQGELEAAEASIKDFEARCMAIEEALATLDRNKTAVEERCQQVHKLLVHVALRARRLSRSAASRWRSVLACVLILLYVARMY